jgi:ankyrin repeat protein
MGETALHWAVQMDQLEVVELLVRYNADLTLENNQGETPLDLDTTPRVRARLLRTSARQACLSFQRSNGMGS